MKSTYSEILREQAGLAFAYPWAMAPMSIRAKPVATAMANTAALSAAIKKHKL